MTTTSLEGEKEQGRGDTNNNSNTVGGDSSDSNSSSSSKSRILITMVSFIWFPYTTIVVLIVVQLTTAFIISPTASPVPPSKEGHIPMNRMTDTTRSSLKATEEVLYGTHILISAVTAPISFQTITIAC